MRIYERRGNIIKKNKNDGNIFFIHTDQLYTHTTHINTTSMTRIVMPGIIRKDDRLEVLQ